MTLRAAARTLALVSRAAGGAVERSGRLPVCAAGKAQADLECAGLAPARPFFPFFFCTENTACQRASRELPVYARSMQNMDTYSYHALSR